MTGWLTNWLTEALEHSRHSRVSGSRKALGHSKSTRALEEHLGTWAPETIGHLKGTSVLRHLRHLCTWPLRHLGTRTLEKGLGTRGTLFSRLKKIQLFFLSEVSICLQQNLSCILMNFQYFKTKAGFGLNHQLVMKCQESYGKETKKDHVEITFFIFWSLWKLKKGI